MTPINRRDSHRAARRPAREARVRRSFDGLVASYIRELSATAAQTGGRSAGAYPAVRC